jgi:glycerol-3-phosphate acyltransferase PlsX
MPTAWIAVDAMGGDDGLAVMLAGVARARRQFDGVHFLLVGEAAIRGGLKAHPISAEFEIVHAPEVVDRRGEPDDSAMPRTPRRGHRHRPGEEGSRRRRCVGGNTGALMAILKLSLRTYPGSTGWQLPRLLALSDTIYRHLDSVLFRMRRAIWSSLAV